MRTVDLIQRKRNGEELAPEEISFLVEGYTKGDIPDYQMSSFLMAVFFQGMSDREVSPLTEDMMHSGETVDLSDIPGVKVGKHSTGGVGDKTSRPSQSATETAEAGEVPSGEQAGAVVTYFEAKGFGFLRPDDGGRDIFFHVSRLSEGLATDLRPGARVLYELGMDRTGKMAASSLRIPPEAPKE